MPTVTNKQPKPTSLAGLKAVKSVAITPSDTVDLSSGITNGLYVGVGGNIKMTMEDGSVVTRKNVSSGMTHPWRVKRVWATTTTATDIIGDY